MGLHFMRMFLVRLSNVRLSLKNLPGTNTPAYFDTTSETQIIYNPTNLFSNIFFSL
jgi:hypothetical protein